jgi:hypothetical protein
MIIIKKNKKDIRLIDKIKDESNIYNVITYDLKTFTLKYTCPNFDDYEFYSLTEEEYNEQLLLMCL